MEKNKMKSIPLALALILTAFNFAAQANDQATSEPANKEIIAAADEEEIEGDASASNKEISEKK
ncbi:MAG: hypothetical protein H0X26_07505 [Alphaproteobacteria bacterium]|nr:hypothetical protein [Alphaproteobacteria bacterium]